MRSRNEYESGRHPGTNGTNEAVQIARHCEQYIRGGNELKSTIVIIAPTY